VISSSVNRGVIEALLVHKQRPTWCRRRVAGG
jgi:hypothetical protein